MKNKKPRRELFPPFFLRNGEAKTSSEEEVAFPKEMTEEGFQKPPLSKGGGFSVIYHRKDGGIPKRIPGGHIKTYRGFLSLSHLR